MTARAPLNDRKRLSLRLLEIFYQLIEGDHGWAERRAILLFSAVLIFVLMGRATERISDWWVLQPFIDTLPAPVVLALSLLHPQTLRHALPPLIALLLALGMAANYVRDLFELPDYSTGRRYLYAAMFGSDYPTINLKSSGYELDRDSAFRMGKDAKLDHHPIVKIGGPGYVNVAPGNVALFEHVGGPSKVVGAGQHFIRRFETLREVIDLRDQFRERAEVKALTKDGLAVIVQNLQVSFRVRTSNRPRTMREAFPFSISAVKRVAYGKTVSIDGPRAWTDSVPNAVVGAVRNYISRTLLDDLVARPEGDARDPRDKIKDTFSHKDTRRRFNEMGVDLLWVSLGHIKTPRDVLEEKANVWKAEWERKAQVKVSEGEAHKVRVMEYAKAMARVDMIENLMKGLPSDLADPKVADALIINWVEALNFATRKLRGSRRHSDDSMFTPDTLRLLQSALYSDNLPEAKAGRAIINDPLPHSPAAAADNGEASEPEDSHKPEAGGSA